MASTHHILFDVLAYDTPTSDLDFHRLSQNASGESFHLTWKRRRKHDCLTVWPYIIYYSHYLGHTKPIVVHCVSKKHPRHF